MDAILFLIFAAIAVVCGINLVVQTHPISSALSLIGVMGSLAALYLLLGGEFIAAAQLVVYAGAIMVLFVFVIMLLNAGTETPEPVRAWANARHRRCWRSSGLDRVPDSGACCPNRRRLRRIPKGTAPRDRKEPLHRIPACRLKSPAS